MLEKLSLLVSKLKLYQSKRFNYRFLRGLCYIALTLLVVVMCVNTVFAQAPPSSTSSSKRVCQNIANTVKEEWQLPLPRCQDFVEQKQDIQNIPEQSRKTCQAILRDLRERENKSKDETTLVDACRTYIMKHDFKVRVDTGWVLFTGSLVFFMNAGFAMLETGFCRRRNAINVLAKNLIVFCLTAVAFWTIGFGLMFGGNEPFFGTHGLFLGNRDSLFPAFKPNPIPLEAKFFFHLTFAGTAATIVSGAIVERIKFPAFLWFTIALVAISYPITGHWVWGSGWLHNFNPDNTDAFLFFDFAGSTVVHAVGGCAGLVGAILLRPRLAKYKEIPTDEYKDLNQNEDTREQTTYRWLPENLHKQIVSLGGHNLSLATLGCLILWLGWFGFNSGSTLELNHHAISHILVATAIGGAAGGIGGLGASYLLYDNKPSLTYIINGILAGSVSITASCAYVSLSSAAIIGLVGGVLVVWVTRVIERLFIDDPVGAVPVHLFCGIWGTLAVGLFSEGQQIAASNSWYAGLEDFPKQGLIIALLNQGNLWDGVQQLFVQLKGIAAIVVWTLIFSLFAWLMIGQLLGGLRVSKDEERRGLDYSFSDQVEPQQVE